MRLFEFKILSVFLLLNQIFISPAHAEYFKNITISNGYFDAGTNFSQNTTGEYGLVDGETYIQIKLSRPKVPSFTCPSGYFLQRGGNAGTTYVRAKYYIEIYDNKFDAENPSYGAAKFSAMARVDLGRNFLPLDTREPEDEVFTIGGRISSEQISSGNLLGFFSYDGNFFLSNKFRITLTGGEKLFVKQSIDLSAICNKTIFGQGPTTSDNIDVLAFLSKNTIDTIDVNYKLINQSINFKPIRFGILNNKFIKIDANSSNNLPLTYSDLTSKTCITNNGVIYLKKNGACKIAISQEGDTKNVPAKPVILSFNIYSKSPGSKFKAIICENDKNITTTTGLKPKCLKGYSQVLNNS
jgi:hypothetical protein